MTYEPETFEGWRDRTSVPEAQSWTVGQHLRWAGVLLTVSLVSLALGELEGFTTLPLLVALLILVHAVVVVTRRAR